MIHPNSQQCLNRLLFGGRLNWLDKGTSLSNTLTTLKGCLTFSLDNIPEYKLLGNTIEHDKPLFPNDSLELQRQRSILPNDASIMDWLKAMRDQDNPIREKAALFWHHHIPSDIHDTASGYQLLETYRKHALGNLRELLYELISNNSFLFYLTGIRSGKKNPNENLARELLELYTLGNGHYTQSDIVQIAKALTGVSCNNRLGNIIIHGEMIDTGIKKILGYSGSFDRYDVIDIILKHPQTAIHVAKSTLKFYAGTNPLDEHVVICADQYRNSGYSFLHLLRFIFTSDWYYQTPAYKTKVKTPIELLIGFQRQTGFSLIGTKAHKRALELLGQRLFMPYNVAGWPSGELWLQGSFRLSRKFLLKAMLDIANRPYDKSSYRYKIYSRVIKPNLRELRYTFDGRIDMFRFNKLLLENGLSTYAWVVGIASKRTDKNPSLSDIIQSDIYQYC